MIEITENAQGYFSHLIDRHEIEGLGLRIAVNSPGTPFANCDLQFCPAGDQQASDRVVQYSGFTMYVAAASEAWLEDAEIDFEEDSTGGQLTIKAPGIKGHEPTEDSPIQERIEWVLETEINPSLASHGGQVALVEITQEMAVVLQFGGGCQGCGMADVTLSQGIQQSLMSRFPEITAVLDATDHQSGENPYYAPGASGESAV
jgi:Fe/S biogenesis protein NfuA